MFGDLNSRIHVRRAGEHEIIGPYVFGDPAAMYSITKNRTFLLEMCSSLQLCIANTFFNHAIENQVTYWGIGATPMAPISHRAFAQLDFCLIQQEWLSCIQDVYSDRSEALSSHHFLVVANLMIDETKTFPRERKYARDVSAYHDPGKTLDIR